MEAITKLAQGISSTATNYVKHARTVYILCLCIGILIAIFGYTPAQGGMLIACCIIGLPAYFIYQGSKEAKKRGK